MRAFMMCIAAVCVTVLCAAAVRGQPVLFTTFGAGDTFSLISPLTVGRQTVTTNTFAAKFTTVGTGTLNTVQVALGPTSPAGQQVTITARFFSHNPATNTPLLLSETLVPQTVTLGAAQIVSFPSTAFTDFSSGTPVTLWLAISLEEPVASGRTVLWDKSLAATGAVALSTNGGAFTNQGAAVPMPAFKLVAESIGGACCNHATGQCLFTVHSECTKWTGFSYVPGNSCSPQFCPPVCRADFNGINGVDVGDIFAFITAWFAGCP